MTHTFDIRFARSAGLAAVFEAPTNRYRWTGSGRLCIDAQGISVALKRGLLSLLIRNRTRHISAADLKEVFREGDSLRVEFVTGVSAPDSLRFWVSDPDTAARIVSLLPTKRTIEFEENAKRGRFRVNRRAAVLAFAVLAAAIACVGILRHDATPGVAAESSVIARSTPAGEPVARAVEATAAVAPSTESALAAKLPAADARNPARPREIVIPVYPGRSETSSATRLDEAATAQPAPAAYASAAERDTAAPSIREQVVEAPPLVFTVRVSPDGIVPIVPGMAAHEAAQKELAIFLDAGQKGSWWELTVHVCTDRTFDDPALWPLRDAELAASRAWRAYSDALGQPNAAAEREFAQLMSSRVYQYVRPN